MLTDGACEEDMLLTADALCRRYPTAADNGDEKRMAEQRGGPPRG